LGGSAFAAFPKTAPNDPDYNPSEQGTQATCLQRPADDEQHYLYSFMPKCSPNATDPENAAGMSLDKAWRTFTPGNGHTVIAYIEGGINWHHDPKELADKVFLNTGELPKATTPGKGKNLCPGARCAADYSDTKDANNNGGRAARRAEHGDVRDRHASAGEAAESSAQPRSQDSELQRSRGRLV